VHGGLSRVRYANIRTGFQYVYLRDFCFPGFGISGIPFAQDLAPVTNKIGVFEGNVATQDGAADTTGLPEYNPGQLWTTFVDGQPVVTETNAGFSGQTEQRCFYSNYRKVADDFMVPANIQVVESYGPAIFMPFDDYRTIKYSMIKVLPQALPASEYSFESQLPDRSIVQDNTGKKPSAIIFSAGESLAQQLATQRANDLRAGLSQAPTATTHTDAGVFGIIALVFGLTAWYLFRRAMVRHR
jgi:hypothetical protein